MVFPSLNWADIIAAIKRYFSRNKTEVDAKDSEEKKNARVLLDYYCGDQKKYLEGIGFEDVDSGKELISKMTLNITKKIIDKISMVYKYPPKRTIINDESVEIDDGTSYAQWTNYVKVFDNTISEAERQKNLFHKVLWRTHYNPALREWRFLIEWDYKAHFIAGDPLNPVGFSVPIVIAADNLEHGHRIKGDDQIYLYYDDERYFYYNTKGQTWTYFIDYNGVRQDSDGKNLYGISPFVELRKGIPVYRYETLGALDLISANQSINQNLNNLNMASHYQSFGIIWDNSGLDKEAGNEILIGPNRQVHVGEGVTLNNLDLNPKLLEMIEVIKFEVMAISNTYNLSVNWHNEATPVSGFSLIVQNMDYIEQRQNDVDEAKSQEDAIYKTIKAQQVFHSKELGEGEPIIVDGILRIDFQELNLPINQTEEITIKKYKLDNNIITPVDEIQANNPDMTYDEALKKYQENKKINGTLTSAEIIRSNLEKEGVIIEE